MIRKAIKSTGECKVKPCEIKKLHESFPAHLLVGCPADQCLCHIHAVGTHDAYNRENLGLQCDHAFAKVVSTTAASHCNHTSLTCFVVLGFSNLPQTESNPCKHPDYIIVGKSQGGAFAVTLLVCL